MKSFIERHPKEKAVEDSMKGYANAGQIGRKNDPADRIFQVAARLLFQRERNRAGYSACPDDLNC